MATKIVMEALSPTMEDGRLVEWKKNEGDAVATGDVLAEVETDKAVMELVARTDGTLLKRVVQDGATVPVAEVVGWIGEPGEEVPGGSAPAAPAAPSPAASDDADDADDADDGVEDVEAGRAPAKPVPSSVPGEEGDSQGEASTPPPGGGTDRSQLPYADRTPPRREPTSLPDMASGRVRASPVARRMAAEQGLDLGSLTGSGPEGRVVKRDVEAGARNVAAAPAAGAPAGPEFTDVPLTQMRKAIAKRLVQSIGPIPTFYLTAEADMERAAAARDALIAADSSGKFSFNDVIIRATAAALRQHPWVNAWWMDTAVRQWQSVHIGVAVAVEDGLITPIVRHADRKTLREISAEVRDMAGRAREKKLKPDEYTGATFSISNLGMFGIDEFTAVINPPEAAILAVGRIEPKPVVVDGAVVVRRRMRLTLSCDHRVIDGATGAAFLKTLVGMLENPMAMVW
ncbi:MAG: 2-oxo acid dehydrogenase subunit E2 [Gemmatimonadales bacterium]|nr:2-oxo acid dehydrogenase subunit E2 [Gemmatimonadales bacterium]